MKKYFSHDADALSFLHLPAIINYNHSSDGKCSTYLPNSHTEMDQSSFLAVNYYNNNSNSQISRHGCVCSPLYKNRTQ